MTIDEHADIYKNINLADDSKISNKYAKYAKCDKMLKCDFQLLPGFIIRYYFVSEVLLCFLCLFGEN